MCQITNKKAKFYDSYHEKNDDFFGIIKDGDFTYFNIQKALNFVMNRSTIQKALDIGCGVGTIAFYLTTKNINVDGFDVSERAINIANHYKKVSGSNKVTFTNADVQKQSFKNKYDLIICTEVIEHLEHDEKMLQSIREALKKGGYLLLSTPSKNAPLFKMGLLVNFDREVGHLRRYTMEELISMFERAGLEVVYQKKTEGILRNFLFTMPLVGHLIRLIKGPLIPLFHIFDDITVHIFGESDLIVVAVKN